MMQLVLIENQLWCQNTPVSNWSNNPTSRGNGWGVWSQWTVSWKYQLFSWFPQFHSGWVITKMHILTHSRACRKQGLSEPSITEQFSLLWLLFSSAVIVHFVSLPLRRPADRRCSDSGTTVGNVSNAAGNASASYAHLCSDLTPRLYRSITQT